MIRCPRPAPYLLTGLACATAVAAAQAPAAGFKVLHEFRGPEGAGPVGGLTLGPDGALYGTTVDKGAYSGGTLFRISTDGSTLQKLHDFGGPGGDGAEPHDDTLHIAPDGTVYGTTLKGGAADAGTLFGWRPDGAYARFYSFGADGGETGREPRSGLVRGPDGGLYGTASIGGDRVCRSGVGCGTIFRFDPATRTVRTVYALRTDDLLSYPWGTPVIQGDTLAVTAHGVTDNGGPFTVRRDGRGFSPVAIGFGATQFAAAVARDANGLLWGVSLNDSGDTQGTIFSVDGRGDFSPHFSFSGRDGAAPYGRLLFEGGFLYGTTAAGGKFGCGTVFRYARGAGRVQTLHDFDCKDGNAPLAGLVSDGRGNLYGTTSAGGRFQNGTVFRIRP